ncbi:hypothetical protein Tco_1377015 [Tanacetum coccineum]
MTTLAEHIIVAGVENRTPFLEKSMYDSWASHIRLFINGKKNAQQLQDDCDIQATNIILHDLPPDVYALQVQVNTRFLNALPPEWSKFVTDVKLAKSLYTTNYDQLYAYLTEFPQLDSGLAVPTFQQGDDPIECINKAMAFLFDVASRFPPSNNQLRTSSNLKNQATIQDGRVTVQQVQRRQTQSFTGTGNQGIATTSRGNYAASQAKTEDLDAYDSDCDDISLAKAVLMENLSSCDPDVLSEVPYSDSYLNVMINHDVQEMSYSEQTHIDDYPDNEINSDSNIIPYSQYLQESQDAEQAFWLKHSNYNLDTSVKSHTPVRIEAPSELPKVSLVNESLKKLKYQLASFDKVVKIRTTSDAITAESSEDEGLGEEDASKQRRIAGIDANEDIYLVNVQTDEDMFGVNDLDGDEVIVESVDALNTAEVTRSVVEEVTAITILVSAATTTTTAITDVEMTLAQALAELKSAKPKADKVVIQEPEQGTTTQTLTTTTDATIITVVITRPRAKGIIFHDQEQAPTPTVSSQQLSQVKVQDKGKDKMVEPILVKKMSKK